MDGERIPIEGQLKSVIGGFRAVYSALLSHRSELMSENGPLVGCRRLPIRIVLRSTRTYALLLSEGLHPSLLEDGLQRDCFFDLLWQQIPRQPYLERIVRHEYQDLLRNDIPVFRSIPISRDLEAASGERISDFFAASGWTAAQDRIAALSQDDAERQVWLIEASIAERLESPALKGGGTGAGQPACGRGKMPDTERAVAAALSIGRRMATLAIHGTSDVTWLGLTNSGDDRWVTTPLRLDLYEGIPGLVLFLAHLGAVSHKEEFLSLAHKAASNLLRQIEAKVSVLKVIGLYSGWGGVIYTLARLGTLWGRTDLIQKALEIVSLLEPLIDEDRSLDIVGGAAGCILALASAYRIAPSPQIVKIARLCGQRLAEEAITIGDGKAWRTSVSSHSPLTGFSHGASGIALALCRLRDLTGEDAMLDLARGAVRYERTLFSRRTGNWPDLRASDDHSNHRADGKTSRRPAFWCHGASGIALSRIGMLDHIDDPETLSEIATGCATTLREGFGRNHSLCHGSMGNLELLSAAGRRLGTDAWEEDLRGNFGALLRDIEARQWRSGHPKGVESVGLMTGLAGMGYGLLRLACPEQAPSLLLAEPPPTATAR
jgi:type 2 lantibiotic biosynthesis protein LanM